MLEYMTGLPANAADALWDTATLLPNKSRPFHSANLLSIS